MWQWGCRVTHSNLTPNPGQLYPRGPRDILHTRVQGDSHHPPIQALTDRKPVRKILCIWNNFQMNMIWRRRLLFILACNYQICFSDLLHGHSCLCAEHVYRGMLGWYFYLRYPHMVYLCNSCVFNFVQMVVTTYILHISKCFFSSPELKAQVSFSDRLSSVVCLSVCPSVRLSVRL